MNSLPEKWQKWIRVAGDYVEKWQCDWNFVIILISKLQNFDRMVHKYFDTFKFYMSLSSKVAWQGNDGYLDVHDQLYLPRQLLKLPVCDAVWFSDVLAVASPHRPAARHAIDAILHTWNANTNCPLTVHLTMAIVDVDGERRSLSWSLWMVAPCTRGHHHSRPNTWGRRMLTKHPHNCGVKKPKLACFWCMLIIIIIFNPR